MNTIEVIVRLALITVLGGYLFIKHRQRVRSRRLEDLSHWAGKTLDATALQPRLQELREDYSVELRPSPHTVNFRANLVARARRTLACLQYFRDKEAMHEHH